MAVTKANKALARRLMFEVWNQGNLDLLDEIARPDCVRHDPAWPEPIHGREAWREYVSTIRHAFADMEVTIHDLVAEGDKVVLRWQAKATHQADFMGIAPTHREVVLMGMSMLCIQEGLIAEAWDGYDALGLMQQLGVIP